MKKTFFFLLLITSCFIIACNQNKTTYRNEILTLDSLILLSDSMQLSIDKIEAYNSDSITKDVDSFINLLNQVNKDSVKFNHIGLVNSYACFSSTFKKFMKYKDAISKDLIKNKHQLESLRASIVNDHLDFYDDSLQLTKDSAVQKALSTEVMYFKLGESKFKKRVGSVIYCHHEYYKTKDSIWTLLNEQL